MDADAGALPTVPVGRAGESLLTTRLRAMLSWSGAKETSSDPVTTLIKAHRRVHPGSDANLLRRAYSVAARMHHGQMRKSGDPYITHPLAVAEILAHLGMDTTTLVAALLHDTVEDTSYTLPQLRADFGPDIALLVDGVTKFDKAHFGARAEAETIRKMIVAAGQDIRVLVIKLADRLHNMKTLDARSASSRARIAGATREVLVPLCDRLGIQALKRELEDKVLLFLDPDEYQRIDAVVSNRPGWNDYMADVVSVGTSALRKEKLSGLVEPRPRHYYSIWKDTKQAGSPVPMDLPRIVVILDGDDPDCYAALCAVHQQWKPIPGRFKDFIAAPKNNLYRSLHTTVLGPEDQMVEVLIRTDQMHRAVEYGVVAPYRYPTRPSRRSTALNLFSTRAAGKQAAPPQRHRGEHAWLRRALDLEQAAPDAVQFVETLRCDLAEQQIQVFAWGRQLLLPAGASPVDVAYELGTRTGDRCVAATVNGVLTPLNATLTDGDVVDILVSRARNHPGPRKEWLDFVKSPNARLRLSRRFTEPEVAAGTVSDRLQLGRAAIGLALRRHDRALADEQRLADLAVAMGYPDLDTLLMAVAEHKITADTVVDQLIASVDLQGDALRDRQANLVPSTREAGDAAQRRKSSTLSR
ncbi:GTP pyrophosphokinase [Catellatospora sp. TT07R-123]|uniref:RelA/SpoT family protein n=1 Tax=Catellatospora sp. TT07R-123 TaxID=2733863 RepID=UPI001B2E8B9A|nr:HD domain-containing protein [Catellatospora sp. TT07R-123]GHJ45037.1 GTP pyrophosphokinase [Catellatospora sp. TT07R-123]